MKTGFISFFRAYGTYVLFIVLALYLGYSASQAALRNYDSQEEIARLRAELERVTIERSRLEALVVYYKTDAFKEKELRRALLLVKPGEVVYALPESSNVAQLDVDSRAVGVPSVKPVVEQTPNWRLWVDEIL